MLTIDFLSLPVVAVGLAGAVGFWVGDWAGAISSVSGCTDWVKPDGVRAVIEVLGAPLVLIGFFRGIRTYIRDGRLKRFEKYQQMQSRYRQDPSIQAVFRWLYPEQFEGDEERRPPVTENDKLNFMGFYEELAIMVNSRIMTPKAAYYTFGFDAVKFWERASDDLKNDQSWKLFKSFAEHANEFIKIHNLEHFKEASLYF